MKKTLSVLSAVLLLIAVLSIHVSADLSVSQHDSWEDIPENSKYHCYSNEPLCDLGRLSEILPDIDRYSIQYGDDPFLFNIESRSRYQLSVAPLKDEAASKTSTKDALFAQYSMDRNGVKSIYDKEGLDVAFYKGNSIEVWHWKIDDYLFSISLNTSAWLDSSNTENEATLNKAWFEENGLMCLYEITDSSNTNSELVRLTKEIVTGIPQEPDNTTSDNSSSVDNSNTVENSDPIENSNPSESSEPVEDTTSEAVSDNNIDTSPVSDAESIPQVNEGINSESATSDRSDDSIISRAEPENSNNTVWIVIIGAATVALVIAAAVIITKKKK